MYPFLSRIHRLSAALILLLLVVAFAALYGHMRAEVKPTHVNPALAMGLSVIADSIVPMKSGDPVLVDAKAWTACASEKELPSATMRNSIAGWLVKLDGRLRDPLKSGISAQGRPYRLDLERLNALLKHAQAQGLELPLQEGQEAPTSPAGDTARAAFRCNSFYAALNWLNLDSDSGNRLAALRWQEQMPRRTNRLSNLDGQARFADFAGEKNRQSDPWGGVPGCVFVQSEKGYGVLPPSRNDRVSSKLCAGALKALQATVPQSEPVSPEAAAARKKVEARSPLEQYMDAKLGRGVLPINASLLRGSARTVKGAEEAGTRMEILDNTVLQSPHAISTIRPAEQQVLQGLVECYTGNSGACVGAKPDMKGYYEQAPARMAGALLVDIRTGEIVAAASADTACYRSDNSGAVRDRLKCPDLPSPPSYNPTLLDNHALYYGYQPGSLVKPLMALGMMEDPGFKAAVLRNPSVMETNLQKSSSDNFLDDFLCADKGFINCDRYVHAFKIAERLGFNRDCIAQLSWGCAQYGLLQGWPQPVDDNTHPETTRYTAGIWGMESLVNGTEGRRRQYVVGSFDPEKAKICSEARWMVVANVKGATMTGCKDPVLNQLRNFGLGQGDTRATPLGIAMVWAQLGNVDAGRSAVAAPHLFRQAFVMNGTAIEKIAPSTYSTKASLDPQSVRVILAGMRKSSIGTAKNECMHAFGSEGSCGSLEWIAGKTGTPGTSRWLRPGDGNDTARKWWRACGRPMVPFMTFKPFVQDLSSEEEESTEDLDPRTGISQGSCSYQPVKWYAALVGDPLNPATRDWRYALVVVVQRNWLLDGKMPTPNWAAYIAFDYLKDYQQRAMLRKQAESMKEDGHG